MSRYTGDVKKDFGKYVALSPYIVADTVAERMGYFMYENSKGGKKRGEEIHAYEKELRAWLLRRFGQVYRAQPKWGKKIAADTLKSRDLLYAFMTHWAAAHAFKNMGLPRTLMMQFQREHGAVSR